MVAQHRLRPPLPGLHAVATPPRAPPLPLPLLLKAQPPLLPQPSQLRLPPHPPQYLPPHPPLAQTHPRYASFRLHRAKRAQLAGAHAYVPHRAIFGPRRPIPAMAVAAPVAAILPLSMGTLCSRPSHARCAPGAVPRALPLSGSALCPAGLGVAHRAMRHGHPRPDRSTAHLSRTGASAGTMRIPTQKSSSYNHEGSHNLGSHRH
mmetsp:Transcript_114395/g.286030  ORF Transcript_114395/g.286030 Transcript_114395/m.286030 type:complete len:205 (+) Transcript_114395:1081-1695(+)